ncbi:CAAX prenyl protease-related protein [Janthinobacterium sp.]|uniref:CAAX prenyl protease-related protein n=1 Tax=Janthinobacterium sp. TaxID=1871054 RepID=UPI00293D35BD|nr:CAAX prenyl protease-related protein [Janthinobacterium sp.]
MFDRLALPRVLPFAVYIAFIFIADMLGRLGWAAQDLRWLYAVKIAAVAAVLLACRRHYTELRWRPLGAAALLTALFTGVVVLVLWISLNADWMVIGASAGFDPRNNGAIDWLMVAIRIGGAALVVPVMEELFWRSFLMRWIDTPKFLDLDPARVGVRGFIVTVILFGFEHNLWLAGIVAGVAYSVLYMRSQNLWSPILAHGVTNGLLGVWIISTGQWTYW